MNDEQLRRIAAMRNHRGDRMRANSRRSMSQKALPLIALRGFIISRRSLGGIVTDLQSRVVDAGGQPILGTSPPRRLTEVGFLSG
jgi:uncharacterized protein